MKANSFILSLISILHFTPVVSAQSSAQSEIQLAEIDQKAYFPKFAQGFVSLKDNQFILKSSESGLQLDKNTGIIRNSEGDKLFLHESSQTSMHQFISVEKDYSKTTLRRIQKDEKEVFEQANQLRNVEVDSRGDLIALTMCDAEVLSALDRKMACVRVTPAVCKDQKLKSERLTDLSNLEAAKERAQSIYKALNVKKSNFEAEQRLFTLAITTKSQSAIGMTDFFNPDVDVNGVQGLGSYLSRVKEACFQTGMLEATRVNLNFLAKSNPNQNQDQAAPAAKVEKKCEDGYKYSAMARGCVTDLERQFDMFQESRAAEEKAVAEAAKKSNPVSKPTSSGRAVKSGSGSK